MPTSPPKATNLVWQPHTVSRGERETLKGQRACVIWFTGLSGSGKSTLANALERQLLKRGHHSYLLDGDNVRCGLNRDLGFSPRDRVENIRRIGELSRLFVDAGLIVIAAFISPYRADRELVRDLLAADEFFEVHVSTALTVCEERDPKGLYAKARAGLVKNFTGIDAPYEKPEAPAIEIDTALLSLDQGVQSILDHLQASGRIRAAAS